MNIQIISLLFTFAHAHTITQTRLCHPDVVTHAGQASALLEYWVNACPEGEQAANQSVFSPHIIDRTFFISPLSPLPLFPRRLLSFLLPSLQVTARLAQTVIPEEQKAAELPSFRAGCLARGRTGDRAFQGPCIRGEGDSPRGTHTASGEEGRGAGRCGDEAQTAHGGAVCRAPPAGPGQDLPAGWRRGLRGQPAGPQSVSQGQGTSHLFLF